MLHILTIVLLFVAGWAVINFAFGVINVAICFLFVAAWAVINGSITTLRWISDAMRKVRK